MEVLYSILVLYPTLKEDSIYSQLCFLNVNLFDKVGLQFDFFKLYGFKCLFVY